MEELRYREDIQPREDICTRLFKIFTKQSRAVCDRFLNADACKITRIRGSFYNLAQLNKQFDAVVSDEYRGSKKPIQEHNKDLG